MAISGDIEIAFGSVRGHRAFRNLSALGRGAYMALVQACLIDGYDPLPETTTALQRLSGAHMQQWKVIEPSVRKALSETLGSLRTKYEKKLSKYEHYSKSNTVKMRKYWDSVRENKKLNSAKQSLEQSTEFYAPMIQPQKESTKFRPTNYDRQARNEALRTNRTDLPSLSD